jgi:hypothetical protein
VSRFSVDLEPEAFAQLQAKALQERRSVRDQAAYLLEQDLKSALVPTPPSGDRLQLVGDRPGAA